MVYANDAAAELLGLPAARSVLAAPSAELVDRFEIRHPDGTPVDPEELPGSGVIRGESPEPMLTLSVRRDTGEPHWFLTKATALEDEDGGILAVIVIEDVTEQHEAALRQRFLAEAGQALASSLDLEETLRRVARLAVPRLADWCAIELPDERGVLEQVALVHVDPALVELAHSLRERYPPDPESPVGTHAAMRTGEPQLIPEITDDMLVAAARDAEHLELARSLGLRSVMVVPMITGGRTLGVMTFVFSESGRRYDAEDLAFAQELAARAAVAIENARLYTERSLVAQTLQASLLPEALPEVDGWRFAADYRPGERGADVGGDFYDVFAVEDGHVVLLGDVTGKGVAAAALTSLVRHTAKTAAMFDARPARVLAMVNPGAAPAAAARAGDDDLRRPARAGADVRGRRPSTPPAQARRPAVREGGHDRTAPGRGAGIRRRARRHARARARGHPGPLHRRCDRHAGAGRALRGGAAARGRRCRAVRPAAVIAAISGALEEYAVGGGLDDRAILVLQRG